jgi:tripartite-type tricarboxylate transporter receptor subunit TctC
MKKKTMSTKWANSGASRRQILKYAGVAMAGAVASPFVGRIESAFAKWPSDKPVRIVVANSPGGPSDLTARFIAPALREILGGAFVVENRPGGGGNIGMQNVMKSEPDGYTFHLSTSIYVINPSLYDPAPYDPFKDMVPVVEIATSPSIFVTRADVGANTMKEWVELARKDQDKFNIGVPPVGTTLHLGAELLKYREKLDKVAVIPHSGGGQAVMGLLNKNVELISSSLAPSHPHLKAGKLKGLMVQGDERWHDLPDIPTAKEAGYENFNFETFTALMAPAKTPPEVLQAMEKAAIQALSNADLRAKMTNAGFRVTARTGAQHGERIAREVPMFRDIIKRANIKPNA